MFGARMKEQITPKKIQKWRDRWKNEDVIEELIRILKSDSPGQEIDDEEKRRRKREAIKLLKLNGILKNDDNFLDLRGIHINQEENCENIYAQDALLQGAVISDVNLRNANLHGAKLQKANLYKTDLRGADLYGSKLYDADMKETSLQGVDFQYSEFIGTNFRGAQVGKYKIINDNCEIQEKNTIFCNNNYYPSFNILNLFKPMKEQWNYTCFHNVSIDLTDTSMAPDLYRYVKDQHYLYRFKQKHPFWYFLWKWTCGCGNSLFLWVFWCFLLIGFFGFVNADFNIPNYLPDIIATPIDFINPLFNNFDCEPVRGWFFESIINFFTLSYNDANPLNLMGKIWIIFEVVVNYLMLGGLISIFTNKLARRSG